jgi:hypothetical protein
MRVAETVRAIASAPTTLHPHPFKSAKKLRGSFQAAGASLSLMHLGPLLKSFYATD